MYKKVLTAVITGGILFGFTPEESTGTVESQTYTVKKEIKLPSDFDPQRAQEKLINARKSGNRKLAEKLSQYLHKWHIENRGTSYSPLTHGYNPEPGPSLQEEEGEGGPGAHLLWGNNIRIDPRDGVRDVKITSLSNGELYAISTYYDGTNWYVVVHRSTDNGETWNINP